MKAEARKLQVGKGEFLFRQNEKSSSLYILKSGQVEIRVLDEQKAVPDDGLILERGRVPFVISSENSPLGEVGAMLKRDRECSALALSPLELIEIPLAQSALDQFIKGTPIIGLNISKAMAKRLAALNKNLVVLEALSRNVKRNFLNYCGIFRRAIDEFADLHKKFGFPWLKEIYLSGAGSLIYSLGKAAEEEEKKAIEFPAPTINFDESGAKIFTAGEIICREGEPGSEMFILLKGRIEVIIGMKSIAAIETKGEIIGEMAVLMSLDAGCEVGARTATLKALEEVKLMVIPASRIIDIVKKDPNVIMHISRMLAERYLSTADKWSRLFGQIQKTIERVGGDKISCVNEYGNFINVLDQKVKDPAIVEQVVNEVRNTYKPMAEEYKKLWQEYEQLTLMKKSV